MVRKLVFLLVLTLSGVAYSQHISSTKTAPDGSITTGSGGTGSQQQQPSKNAPDKQSYASHYERAQYLSDMMPSAFEPTPYVYTPSVSVTSLKEARTYYRTQIGKRDQALEQIQGMDQYETRVELVQYATNSLKISREHYLKDEFEEGKLASHIADVFLDLSTSLTPGVGWARDVYEAISGKDLLNGEELGKVSRTMAILGAATGGVVTSAVKAVKVFEKLARIADKIPFQTANKIFESKPLTEIKETLSFFKKHKFWKQNEREFADFVTAFESKTTRTRVLTEDVKGFRYYNPSIPQSNPRGNWLTTSKVADPEMNLALKHPGNYEAKEWIIPKGTEVLEGTVAPKFGKPGGAFQIFVPDSGVLK